MAIPVQDQSAAETARLERSGRIPETPAVDAGAVKNLTGATPSFLQQMPGSRPSTQEKADYESAAREFYRQEALSELAGMKAEGRAGRRMLGELKTAGLTAEDVAAKREEAMRRIGEEPVLTPTKENMKDFATVFSMLSALTFAVGGSGRGSGMQALSALTGAMEGWNKGRKDVFERNLKEFEKQLQSYKARQERELKLLESIYKERSFKSEEARMLAAEYIAEDAGYSAALLKKGDLKGSYETKKKAYEAAIGAEKLFNQMMSRAFLKQMGTTEGKMKPSAKVSEGYVSLVTLKDDITSMTRDLQDPELQQMIRRYRVEGFLSEESKLLDQWLSTPLPPKLNKFLTKVRDVRNNYYLDKSGKAVTGGEALRNYGTVPQPGDSPERMVQKFEGLYDRVSRQISLTQKLYAFPEIDDDLSGRSTGLTPGQNYYSGAPTPQTITKRYNTLQEAQAAERRGEISKNDKFYVGNTLHEVY